MDEHPGRQDAPAFLVVGQFGRPHGIQGEINLSVLTDFPERLKAGVLVYVGEQHRPLRIRRSRPHGAGLLLSFKGYDTPEQVSELTRSLVYVRGDDRPPLAEGEYYHHELVGLQVVDEEGQPLGELVQILSNPANDIYVVRPRAGKEILLPAIEDVILDIDLEKGQVRVHLLPGLLPDE
jgi:16S rRNA processing protein RimM